MGRATQISNLAGGALADASVTAAKLATDAVETAKIKDVNVTTAKIADDAVTAAKIPAEGTTASQPANKSTTSTSQVMAGLAQTFTPTLTGRGICIIVATGENSVAGNGLLLGGARYGTGAAPADNDALTGTAIAQAPALSILFTTAGNRYSITYIFRFTGLTPATAYWLDMQWAAVTGGTVQLKTIQVIVKEDTSV